MDHSERFGNNGKERETTVVNPPKIIMSLNNSVHVKVTRLKGMNSHNNNNIVTIGTWNVRTLLQSGKLENIKKEMSRTGVNILGMSEMRWIGAGEIRSDKFKMIYSGEVSHTKGVGLILDQKYANTVTSFLGDIR